MRIVVKAKLDVDLYTVHFKLECTKHTVLDLAKVNIFKLKALGHDTCFKCYSSSVYQQTEPTQKDTYNNSMHNINQYRDILMDYIRTFKRSLRACS